MKKVSLILVGCLAIIIALSGCGSKTTSNTINTTTSKVNNVVQNSGNDVKPKTDVNNSKTTSSEVKKLDNSKDIVYTSFSKKSDSYSYNIPTINIDSSNVKTINSEIQKDYKTKVDQELTNEKQGLSATMESVKYDSYINGNILSLVISSEYPNDCKYYKVYNVDVDTGKSISNTQLLQHKNITKTNFLNKLSKVYGEKFIELFGKKDSQNDQEFYSSQYNKTINSNNYSIDTSIFLNSNNTISVIAQIYSLAGADSYYYIIDTGM